MGAYVEHSFRRAFILNEERARRIKDTVEFRLAKRSNSISLIYKVYRGDGYSYTTQQIDDVTREDNEDWRRIVRLDITAKEKDMLELEITFDADGVYIHIVGDNRDEVFLLFSDLREYIQSEVAVVRVFTKASGNLISAILVGLLMLFFSWLVVYRVPVRSPEEYKSVIESTDAIPKLNFLIENLRSQEPRRVGIFFLLGIVVVMLFGVTKTFEKIGKYFFAGNEFVFGKQKHAFERRQRLRSNLFWVCIVGLVVSVLAGLLLSLV